MTEEELVPALATPPGNEIARPRMSSHVNVSQGEMEEGIGDHELGEESAKEEDPLVEFAHEPDAETEPGANAGDPIQTESNDFHRVPLWPTWEQRSVGKLPPLTHWGLH